MNEHKYGVFCEVEGGVTGYRTSWLQENGQQFLGSRKEAEEKAAEYNREMRAYTCAQFRYTACIYK